MPSSPPQDIRAQLEGLRRTYAAQLEMRVEQIEDAWNQLLHNNWDPAILQTLHRMVHTLAGSGATFGFHYLSNVARTLEVLLGGVLEAGTAPIALQRIQIHTLLASLKQAVTHSEQMLPPPDLVDHVPSLDSPIYDENNRLIYLADDDLELAKDLALQISYFGYEIEIFSDCQLLIAATQENRPAAIISDIVFPNSPSAGIEMVNSLKQLSEAVTPPILFISVRDDLTARLEAARAGVKAFFTKPVNVPQLIDKLDELTTTRAQEPYRILIVDDEAYLATYYSLILQQAHMLAAVVTDPADLMVALDEFNPDLILMDVYMPNCTGMELATVIRQQESYVGIPIVFLSTETNIHKQLIAMSLGGDDFLTKPIEPEHLIMAVASRSRRSRTLRSLMTRDSLTGLLNHTKTKDQLLYEVLRAERQGTQVVFAMIDLDHFKSVNDSYGHAAGDRVLKSLSRLLQQRLRKTDTIGRYGGEEFAVILPDTDGEAALKILDDIRIKFSQVRQQAEDATFSSTFSCGIAVYPEFKDVSYLKMAADKALYRAKHQGRNQLVLASPLSENRLD
ncbi:MAG: diguanylate cyclase [Cyanobacteriota bacterium]|nr:diguanylate cyclase [Cyanobacteriota bacterium]